MKKLVIYLLILICLLSGCSLNGDSEVFRDYKGISVDASCIKNVYIGDSRDCIDFSGLKVNGIKKDGTVDENISGYTITSLSLNVGSVVTDKHIGKQTFTVSYVDGGSTFTDTFSITVKDPRDYMILGYDSASGTNQFQNKLKSGLSLTDLTDIHYVEFYETEDIPSAYSLTNGINIDVNDEGFVKAYLITKENENDTIVITGERVVANTDCNKMFDSGSESIYAFDSVKKIELKDLNTSFVTDMSNMFKDCKLLEYVDLSDFDTSNVTTLECMFYGCLKLGSIDVSSFNTSKVTNMEGMFMNCNQLAQLDVSKFNTYNVTDMSNMFNSCYRIQSLDLSNFNTSNVTTMEMMFKACFSLSNLNVIGFDTSKVTSMEQMFYRCISLESLDLSSFTTTEVLNNMCSMFMYCSNLISLDISNNEFSAQYVSDLQNVIIDDDWCAITDLFTGVKDNIEIYVNSYLDIWNNIPSSTIGSVTFILKYANS